MTLRWLNGPLTLLSGRRTLSILIYHRVLPIPDPLFPHEVTAPDFDTQMRALVATFQVLPLTEAVERLRNRSLPVRAVCVTFDDGYRDNLEVALPILRKHGVPATVFIATDFLDGGRMWNDTVIEAVRRANGAELDLRPLGLDYWPMTTLEARRTAIAALLPQLKHRQFETRARLVDEIANIAGVELPDDLMLASEQVRVLHREGVEIGAHTRSHPILATMDDGQAREQIISSKHRLEELLSAPVRLFAYPNGKPGQDYRREHVRMVREAGFMAAVSTAIGVATTGADIHQLPRFPPWDKQPLRFTTRLAFNLWRTRFQMA
jgi:peptidoglycan/xylan/chitin deacetylase (PgdA/CDA1 family)